MQAEGRDAPVFGLTGNSRVKITRLHIAGKNKKTTFALQNKYGRIFPADLPSSGVKPAFTFKHSTLFYLSNGADLYPRHDWFREAE
jgi:hypothetical protein